MKKVVFIIALMACMIGVQAQQYITSGLVEFEMRTNNHKTFGDGIWAEMWKDKIPQFSTSWYHFTFTDNKAVYKFNRLDERTKLPWGNNNVEDNFWFTDYGAGTFTDQKFVFDNTYLLQDSLMRIDWKLVPNETREIAGFNCRKAVGKIFDSVYVFAFYTDEIIVSGGPMGIHGLPGMILGITIPRMFTSWIATKVQVNGVNTSIVAPPVKGKKKKAKELQETVIKVTKDWGTWGQQQVWNLFL